MIDPVILIIDDDTGVHTQVDLVLGATLNKPLLHAQHPRI